MNILLLSLKDEATGNATTAGRIRSHLESAGHRVCHMSSDQEWSSEQLALLVEKEAISLAIGVHAYGAGRHLRHLAVPTIIIFGGTDLNERVHDADAFFIMTEAVTAASALVVFDDDFFTKAAKAWPNALNKIHRISQAVDVCPSSFSFKKHAGLIATDRLILLPSGLRPVKDPLFCSEVFSRWHRQDPCIRLAIIGAVRDPVYAKEAITILGRLPGVTYHPPLPRCDLHAAMHEADIVLNTSISESCPNAVLEAMALGTPVLVRDIPGNRSIVEDRKTGLYFTTAEECKMAASILLTDDVLRLQLIENASQVIRKKHGMDVERKAYRSVVDSVMCISQ